jgi:hypothetical protein
MPYLLDMARMQRWAELFLEQDYEVTQLPSYEPRVASNPFLAFQQIPTRSRYRFMLEEAQYTIMGFIKGPVCRGQIALNVINDHFWVVFIDPEAEEWQEAGKFLAQEAPFLRLPAQSSANALPISTWVRFSRSAKKYLVARRDHLNELFPSNDDLTLDLIWDGDGDNPNASLTIFRHFDSATVSKGLVGDTPKTAWVIGYSLLERIHYLLVAGFDVYGNVGHQLNTRLYMDFLRMEGESNFISLMPAPYGEELFKSWYLDAQSHISSYVNDIQHRGSEPVGIDYQTGNPKTEFFELLEQRDGPQVFSPDPINRPQTIGSDDPLLSKLQKLAQVSGEDLLELPEVSVLRVTDQSGAQRLYSLVRNRSHTNVASLMGESRRLIPSEQTLTVAAGVYGSYPNVFFDVNEDDLDGFVGSLQQMATAEDYTQLVGRYGVRRTDKKFWPYSDWLHKHYRTSLPIQAGLLDFNRLENR